MRRRVSTRPILLVTIVSALAPSVRGNDGEIGAQREVEAIEALRRKGAYVKLDADGHAVVVEVDRFDGEFSDCDMYHVGCLPHLRELCLSYTVVTDAGLIVLRNARQLEVLMLKNVDRRDEPAPISDDGMKHLQGLTNLRHLRLDGTDVSDAGLKYLRGLTRLEDLDLFGTEISDAGLVHLRGLKNLKYLNIGESQWHETGGSISVEAANELRRFLPDCRVDHY